MSSPCSVETPVIIVGAGLSGLHTAWSLRRAGIDCKVVEARDRSGGRALSWSSHGDNNVGRFDLGPSWFWPGQQRIENLVRALGLEVQRFSQFADGRSVFEDQTGAIRQNVPGISMAGSWRLSGGIQQLTDHLVAALPDDTVRLSCPVREIAWNATDATIQVHCADPQDSVFNARSVVLALPPRIALASIKFSPDLSDQRRSDIRSIQTWMASQAKFVATFDAPHWRTAGYSGDAFSLRGPLREVHDASIDHAGRFALFGFLGTPTEQRKRDPEVLATAALDQLQRLFDVPQDSVVGWQLKDWALDRYTCTEEDSLEPPVHQTQTLQPVTEQAWPGNLIWSGSETADSRFRNNGYLEGALEASERTVGLLLDNEYVDGN